MKSIYRITGTLFALFLAVAVYARFVEPLWIEVRRVDIPLDGLTAPIRVAHLSDWHTAPAVYATIDRSIAETERARPDLIFLTGDFVSATTGFDADWLVSRLHAVSRIAPTRAVLGNHDGGAWNAAYGDSDSPPTILLSHNPDSKALLAKFDWDLMLSGHTHGGQVVVPILGWNPAPVYDRRYLRGLYEWKARRIYISRGVGSGFPMRFNARPDVSILDLRPGRRAVSSSCGPGSR
ncbi:MAG: metallophosphoesterase [Bryobacteraceae bacterium]|nr:metallophosphoesterase [Bryobacteraceae bacterium]